MGNMNQSEIDAFLDEPHIAHMVTVWPDGRPQVAPVWFLEEDGIVYVITGANAVKIRNIRRNPLVSLSLATDQRPLKYVIMHGEAEVTDRDLNRMVERICIRYDGPQRGVEYAKELLAQNRMRLIEIRVTRTISWNGED